ncbi:MAG: nucleoside phosphorylase [Fibrobacteres bacterium]|nr:nucleoside phosphorylase [Fibrobacterota bacterium]
MPDILNQPPILRSKAYDHDSEFKPENMLREARQQKSIADIKLPSICILDPDGDIVRNLISSGRGHLNASWACYHTQLYNFEHEEISFGVVGCVVGSSFAVLVAEELFASGCELLISITSSGQIVPKQNPPYFILIERALRDEGTSYHYLPPSNYSSISSDLLKILKSTFSNMSLPVYAGSTWTTDAPFRETELAIAAARAEGILAVEMEAAALYAFSEARKKPVICFAFVTNQMGKSENDFEKGEADGSQVAFELISTTAQSWLSSRI